MKLLIPLIGMSYASSHSDELNRVISQFRSTFDIRSGWQEGFKSFASLIMFNQELCNELQSCVDTMQTYFQEFVMDDQTNNYVTLAFCGMPEDTKPSGSRGNVWWYDGEYATGDRPYWIVDQSTTQETYACSTKGMYMRGVEVDISISLQASPDWRHTKWDISHDEIINKDFNGEEVHGQPMFDYTGREDCCNEKDRCCTSTCACGTAAGVGENQCKNSDGKTVEDNTDNCGMPNPCGKADVMHKMWAADINDQLYGKDTHVLMTMCQKDGKWADESKDCSDPRSGNCLTPGWSLQGAGQMGFALFEPAQFSNSIWDHIEWDKAPRSTTGDDAEDHPMGDGDGWNPFHYSQCCTTVAIAPQI